MCGVSAPSSGRSVVGAFVAACRPRQWVKNLLVLLAPAGAGLLVSESAWELVPGLFVLFLGFSLTASGTYLDNDVLDAACDRLDPRKVVRPVAAGALPPAAARLGSRVLVPLGVVLVGWVSPPAAGLLVVYAVNTLSYSRVVKRVPFLEVGALAFGFVLRAAAGAVVVSAPLAGWFLPLVSSVAVLVVLVKRSSEVREGVSRRHVLRFYDPAVLACLRGAFLVVSVCLYVGWVVTGPRLVPAAVSIVPLAVALVRVSASSGSGLGAEPERLVFSDRVLLLCAVCWFSLFVFASS